MAPEVPMNLRLFALYTHWCIADSVRFALFHEPTGKADRELLEKMGPATAKLAMLQSSIWRLSVLYGLEFVVVEGYRELGDKSERVEALLDPERIDKLRLFRNGVFHYQKEPLGPKLLGFLEQPDSETWIKELHAAFEEFFRTRLPVEDYLSKMRAGSVGGRV